MWHLFVFKKDVDSVLSCFELLLRMWMVKACVLMRDVSKGVYKVPEMKGR